MSDRLDHVHSISQTKCRERRAPCSGPGDWTSVLRDLDDQLDALRQPSRLPGDPADLALTVVTEALAVAVALGDALSQTTSDAGHSPNGPYPGTSSDSVAVYAGIDCRYLDHRARALRNALQSVDDYIWWGGLNAQR